MNLSWKSKLISRTLCCFWFSTCALQQHASATETSGVSFGAFVDAYYAYDLNLPPSFDRAYTTQPARHNEFNINLAYLESKLEREKVHGRIAFQAGTSVQSNYSGEPTIGSVSGATLSRNIQEAYLGYRLGERTWLDAGVMFSHIGLESFISKENLAYTRSLVSDYSPYYETGLRFTTELSHQMAFQILILNGWQNISESNPSKALGTRLSYSVSPELDLTYNTFFGQEALFRHFHDIVIKYSPNDFWTYALQADVGFQIDSAATWNGFAFIAKRQLSQSLALVGRIERYADPQNVLTSTPNGDPFQVFGSSIGADIELDNHTCWRNEIRAYWASARIFTSSVDPTNKDSILVSSISASF